MSIDFQTLLRTHSGPCCGFFSPPRIERQAQGLYRNLWVAATELGDLTQLHRAPMSDRGIGALAGYGVSFDHGTAVTRAAGEAVERYASVMFPETGIRTATKTELGASAIALEQLPRASPAERARWTGTIGLREVDAHSRIDWVAAWSLTEKRPKYLPLDMAYMGMRRAITEMVAVPISTGFAAGSSYRMAIQSGLQEVIERDAVALWWLGRRRVPHIDPTTLERSAVHDFLRHADICGVRTILLDLSTDAGFHTVGVVQLSASYPHAVFMAACRADLGAAVLRAIEEVGSVRQALASNRADPDLDLDRLKAGLVHDPIAFAEVYASSRDHSAFDFCLEPGHAAPRAPTSNLSETVARLAELGHEVLVVDCTIPDVRALGFRVVRVVVPGLMGISFTHAIRFLGEPRLQRVLALPDEADALELCHDAPLPFA